MANKDFFNKLAFTWDDICFHDENKLNKIIELSSIKSNAKILDVGTGTGVLIKYLLKQNPIKITAVDVSENMIAVAKKKYIESNVEFIVEDIMKYNNDTFDYIFLYSVYPHIQNEDNLFKHLAQLLNKNGKVIIAHSESKEDINKIHNENKKVKDDILPNVEVVIKRMRKYFKIDKFIDNDEMYYISGIVVRDSLDL